MCCWYSQCQLVTCYQIVIVSCKPKLCTLLVCWAVSWNEPQSLHKRDSSAIKPMECNYFCRWQWPGCKPVTSNIFWQVKDALSKIAVGLELTLFHTSNIVSINSAFIDSPVLNFHLTNRFWTHWIRIGLRYSRLCRTLL